MTSLRKLLLVAILVVATIGGVAATALFVQDNPVLVANSPIPPPPPPWAV
jgi:hypothetical protein